MLVKFVINGCKKCSDWMLSQHLDKPFQHMLKNVPAGVRLDKFSIGECRKYWESIQSVHHPKTHIINSSATLSAKANIFKCTRFDLKIFLQRHSYLENLLHIYSNQPPIQLIDVTRFCILFSIFLCYEIILFLTPAQRFRSLRRWEFVSKNLWPEGNNCWRDA